MDPMSWLDSANYSTGKYSVSTQDLNILHPLLASHNGFMNLFYFTSVLLSVISLIKIPWVPV